MRVADYVMACFAMAMFAACIYLMSQPHSRHSARVEQCHLAGGAWVDEGDFCVRRLP